MKNLFLLMWCVFLVCGYFGAASVLSTSIELIEKLALTDADGVVSEVIRQNKSSDLVLLSVAKKEAWSFFHQTFGLFSITSFILAFVVSRRMVKFGGDSQRQDNISTNGLISILLLSVLALMMIGYAVQIGVNNPLQGSIKGTGQPSGFIFGNGAKWGWNCWTNPFIFPSYCWMGSAILFWLTTKWVDFRELNLKDECGNQDVNKFILYTNNLHYTRRFTLALVVFLLFLLLPTVFLDGVILLEPLKALLVVGLSGLMTSMVQKNRGNRAAEKRLGVITFLLGLFLIGVMLVILKGLNDLGAGLILIFVVLLVCFSVVFNKAVWLMGLVFYFGAYLLKKMAPDIIFSSQDRLQDWALSDYFISSGLGDSHIPGTASSPDFAKALWGIASGGMTGRGTGLFALNGNDGFYVASMAYGYNDRAGSVLIEMFGWGGLSIVMLIFAALILTSLVLYVKPQQTFNPRYGLSLGLAALCFGQVVVHFGGNFGFIPFTGIVLPFISHSGLSLLVNLILITFTAAAYVPRDSGIQEAVVATKGRISGMFAFIGITMAIILGYAFWETVVKGAEYSTRVRYDIQADQSIKRVINPRLFLLTEQLDVSGQIVDMTYDPQNPDTIASGLIKDETGEYRLSHFNEEDFFLHYFEEEHAFDLKGLSQQELIDREYYNKICVLKDGEYHQFGGQTLTEARARTSALIERISELNPDQDLHSVFNCSVEKVRIGRLWKEKVLGVPVDSNNPEMGCKVELEGETKIVLPYLSGTTTLNPNHSVWFFNEDSQTIETSLKPLLQYGGTAASSVKPLKNDAMRADGSNICMVATWNTSVEERFGEFKSGNNCEVTDVHGRNIVYGSNTIDGNEIGRGSARSIVIEEVSDGVKGQCIAKVERVGCMVDGQIEIDQHTPDLINGIMRTKVYYGSNFSLNAGDTSCKVSKDTMGALKQLRSDNAELRAYQYYYPVAMERLVSNFEDDIVTLHQFTQATTEQQRVYQTEFEKLVPQTIVQIGLNAKLQDTVRKIVSEHQQILEAPSVQALVFDVKSGHILAQAQATQPHSSFVQYLDAGDYDNLYADRGMYGYGRNNLNSSMVPASTFKVLHALAAIEGGLTDFEHTCDVHNGYQPEDANWPCKNGSDCSIKDYGPQKGYASHNSTPSGKTNLSWAITQSCNQYFAALAYEHTHPEVLTRACSDKGLKFGAYGECSLKSPQSRGAASNGWGQELLMDVYQMAGVLQSVSTNYQPYLEPWDAYVDPAKRSQKSHGDLKPLFEGTGGQQIEKHVLKGMFDHVIARGQSNRISKVRVYGKTGTGDHNIAFNSYSTEKEGEYIRKVTYNKGKSNEKTLWIEDYEAPYGVSKNYKTKSGKAIPSNMAIYVALIENKNKTITKKLSYDRLGIVVRVPRTEKKPETATSVTGGGIAGPIAEEIIQVLSDMDLVP